MRKINISIALFLVLMLLSSCYGPVTPPSNPDISAADIKTNIEYLASDKLEGRLTGTAGADAAADYIMNGFSRYGLKTAPGHEYIQNYQFVADMLVSPENALAITLSGRIKPLAADAFLPAAFSGSGQLNAELVFAGYGISAPKLNYDDYKDIDVKGKIVLILRDNPEYDKPRSDFEDYASFRYKAKTAKDKGAAALLIANTALPKINEDKLPEFRYDRAQSFSDFPVVFVKLAAADLILGNDGLSVAATQDTIKRTKSPYSKNLKSGITGSISVKPVEGTGKNIIGILEGNDPVLKSQYVVVGAHYDHLGFGVEGSLYRGKEKLIHPGADDNASGTAGVMELANKLASEKSNKRSIVFTAFSGEELGMLGSAYYVNNSFLPIDSAVSMINLDMIGRLNSEKSLIVYGTGTSSLFKNLIDSLNRPYKFTITKNDEGFGPSDQSSFYGKNIPVLFLFTGTHTDYHRPTDKTDKINFAGEDSVLHYAHDIVLSLANSPARPDYINVPRKGSDRGGAWKVYVGTVPDFGYQGEGFKISGVNEGSPARKAGIQAGDIMTSFAGNKISNIYDYVYALKNCVPGDVVDVILTRGGSQITVKLELGVK